jgi:ankyrin repeat protein
MGAKHPKRKPRPGVDEYGRTPLHYAAADGDTSQVEKLLRKGLFRTGADPNAQDDCGWSPLHFAAQAQSAPVTAALLRAGADVGLRESFGNTPLIRAVFSSRGNGSVIQLLRSAGADPMAANHSGVTPVELARTIANYDIAQFFADIP